MMKGGIGNMMKQAQALQANMQKAQAEIAAMEVVGESGGGMVRITVNGKHEAKRVQLDPSFQLVAIAPLFQSTVHKPAGTLMKRSCFVLIHQGLPFQTKYRYAGLNKPIKAEQIK